MPLPRTAKAVTGAFLVSGVVHLVKPEVFEPLIPDQLPGTQGRAAGLSPLLVRGPSWNARRVRS